MAGASLLTLLDDIAAILDDVALMSKVAAKKSAVVADDVGTMTKIATQKTAGVLGDDLALNAQQVAGVRADRELPVVWAVARGSALNKAILLPAALAISVLAPSLITPLLMLGGAYLCFEGVEKIAHKLLHSASEDAAAHQAHAQANADASVDMQTLEKSKIQGAVRTDFILSAEIIVIALGSVAQAPLLQKIGVLLAIAVLMTVGVYGLVAAIVKLDDLGLWLHRQRTSLAQELGRGILRAAPWLMKFLSLAGTAAMFLVGGGILVHGVPSLHHWVEASGAAVAQGAAGGLWQALAVNGLNAAVGIAAGALILLLLTPLLRWKQGRAGRAG